MARLYYEKPKTAAALASGSPPALTEWAEKITKLIPSEIVAGYLTLVGLISKLTSNAPLWMWISVGACFVLTPLYLKKVAEPGKPIRNHLIVSAFAFIVWAYSVSGHLVVPNYYDAAVASIVLVLFTLISGVIPMDQ